jgi:hypothetical protein
MELMARLLACPSCRRHVQASASDCPFCGNSLAILAILAVPSVDLTTSAPGRLSVLLLGLCLVGCTSGKEETKKTDQPKINVPPQPEPAPPQPEPAPTTAIAPEPEPEPPVPASTTATEPPPVEGTDAGAKIDDPPPVVEENLEPKTKYGGPRPQKKYGAPPKPDDMGL